MAKLADALSDPLITTIDLIRHGEPAGGEMYRGTKDDPLSELGWQQMRDAVAKPAAWDQIVSSPLLRCAEFARELAQQRDIPLAIEPEFREICFGDWEGQRPQQLTAADPQQLLNFWLNPVAHSPRNAEPFVQFNERIQQAWQSLLATYTGKHLLLVCHGGVIRALLSQLTDMPVENTFRWHVPYAAVSRIRIYTEQGGDADGRQVPTLVFHAGQL
jgi:alpha-ribazole phosphatase/probable phosphoglycerate mutase